MERRWIILIATVGLIMSTLIVGLLIHESFHMVNCSEDVCQSPECVQAAAQILSYIDPETDPCENFYAFVCGNFIKTAEIPEDMKEISTTSIITEGLQKQLRAGLEEPVELSEIKAYKTMKTYYQACMNTEAIERREVRVIRELLKKAGGWPVLEEHTWDNRHLDWYYYVYKFRQLGIRTDYFFELHVNNDFRNSTFHILQIDQPTFTLPRDFLINEGQNEYIEEYRRYMVNVAVYLGASEYQAIRELREALKLEMNLAKISLSNEARTSIINNYKTATIEELAASSKIPWLDYINNLISPHIPVTTHERIQVLVPNYIKDLDHLLSTTPTRVQVNYLVWKAVESLIPYLTEDLREMEMRFQSTTSGVVERLPRWKECVQEVYRRFPAVLSSLYVSKFYDQNSTQRVEGIAQSIRKEYRSGVQDTDWMDKETKNSALEKADSIINIVGYPAELDDANVLDEIYNEVEIDDREYLKSCLNISVALENWKFTHLRVLKQKSAWIDHSYVAEVNAFYSYLTNTITIPAGLLQGTYFSRNRPNYLNYGGVGFAVAHEIAHAFDDSGRQFDKDGNLLDWWESHTKASYLNKIQCFVDQYSNYTLTDINQTVNAQITLDENIADHGGIKHAYNAYVKWAQENGNERMLPGLDFSPVQLFWISFAMNYCSKQRPEHVKLALTTSPHSPPEFRINGPLSNLQDFAIDFECPDDSAMYVSERCGVW